MSLELNCAGVVSCVAREAVPRYGVGREFLAAWGLEGMRNGAVEEARGLVIGSELLQVCCSRKCERVQINSRPRSLHSLILS